MTQLAGKSGLRVASRVFEETGHRGGVARQETVCKAGTETQATAFLTHQSLAPADPCEHISGGLSSPLEPLASNWGPGGWHGISLFVAVCTRT